MIPVADYNKWKTVSDHGSITGRRRNNLGPMKPWSSFVAFEKSVHTIDPHSGLPDITYAIGHPAPKIYWPDKLSAPRASPTGSERSGGVETPEHVATWHTVAPAFLDFSNNDPRSKLLRDLDLEQSRIHDSLQLVGLAESPFPPCLGTGPGTTTVAGSTSTTSIGAGGAVFDGVHDQGLERLVGRIVGAPVPSKHPILWVSGVERAGQHALGFPSFSNVLFSDWRSPQAAACQFTTRVADLTDEFEIDESKTAALSTLAHVVPTIESSCALAWNGSPAPGNVLAGRGQMTEAGYFPRPTASKEPKIVFYASRSGGGPLSGGAGAGDKHTISNVNGVPHVVGHLDLAAPWYAGGGVDAPPKVDFERYEKTGDYGGAWIEVLLRNDPTEQHITPGADFGRTVHSGLLKWQTRLPIIVFPPETPPLIPRFPSEPLGSGVNVNPPRPQTGGVVVDPDGPQDGEFDPPEEFDPFLDPLRGFSNPFGDPNATLEPASGSEPLAREERLGVQGLANIDSYARVWNYLSNPGLVFTPSLLNVDRGDHRFNLYPSAEELDEIRRAPPSALLLPFGKQLGGAFKRECGVADAAQFYNGAVAGGIGVYPPTKNIDQRVRARKTVETYFALCNDGTTPEVFLGFGCPAQTGEAAGKVPGGFVLGLESSEMKWWGTNASTGDREFALWELDDQGAVEFYSRRHKQTDETLNFTAILGRTHKVNTSGGAVTADLPALSSSNYGERITFIDVGGSCATNPLTLNPDGSDTFTHTSTDPELNTNFGFMTIEATSDGWALVARGNSDGSTNLLARSYLTITANIDMTDNPEVTLYFVDTTSNTVELALGAAADYAGVAITMIDVAANFSTNNFTIDPGLATINGASGFTGNIDEMSVTITSNGTNWFIE